MTKKIKFGKVDGYNIGRRNCEVEIEFGFREFPNQEPYFTVCAGVWNNLHTDIIEGGQCIDRIGNYKSVGRNYLYKIIKNLWEKYHLKKYSEIPEADRHVIETILAEDEIQEVK